MERQISGWRRFFGLSTLLTESKFLSLSLNMLGNNPNSRCCYEEEIRTMLEEACVVGNSRLPFHGLNDSRIACGLVGARG